jgi:hypothetical protein
MTTTIDANRLKNMASLAIIIRPTRILGLDAKIERVGHSSQDETKKTFIRNRYYALTCVREDTPRLAQF